MTHAGSLLLLAILCAPCAWADDAQAPGPALEALQHAVPGFQLEQVKRPEGAPVEKGLTPEQLWKLKQFSDALSQEFVDPVDAERLYNGAMDGMALSLDPYTRFFSREEFAVYKARFKNAAGGIGVGIVHNGGKETVISFVRPGSPAADAGVKAGDTLIAVDGTPAFSLPLPDVAFKIGGAPGTRVTLTLERDGVRRTTAVVRAEIQQRNIFPKLLPGGVGYLHFQSFTENTDSEVRQAVRELVRLGARSLILDLRGNTGGDLGAAVRVAKDFLSADQVILSRKSRWGEETVNMTSVDGTFHLIPLKILVNGNSASASEILAGAIQENGRGILVGGRTFGKNLIQDVHDLPDGSGFKITHERWFTPTGRSIEKDMSGKNGGLVPDIAVEVPKELDERIEQELFRAVNGIPPSPTLKDPVLEAALNAR